MADETLRLGVDPRPAVEGFRQYDQAAEQSIQKTEQLARTIKLHEQAERERLATERQVTALLHSEANAMNEVADATKSMNAAHAEALRWNQHHDQVARAQAQSMAAVHAEALRMNAAFDAQNTTVADGVQGLGRLNGTLASLARQAAGVHPVVGQVANVIGTFALGAATTTAVLGGLAAIAFAIRKIGEESRTAREQHERTVQSLAQAGAERFGNDLGAADAAIAKLEADHRRLVVRRLTARAAGSMYTPLLDREIWEAADQLGRARGGRVAMLEDLPFEGPLLDVNAQYRSQREQREYLFAQDAAARVKAQLQRDLANEMYSFRQVGDFSEPDAFGNTIERGMFDNVGRMHAQLQERQRELEEAARRRAQAEVELARRREQANQALVASLITVGRAYGGVTEQILSLASATMRLSSMPGFRGTKGTGELGAVTTGDELRGYGASLMTGVGYGVSTGNAGLGAIAGGASGYIMAGPGGAILGALGGIVAGLFENAERYREAQRIWNRSFEDFQTLFVDQTALEQNLKTVERMYEDLRKAAEQAWKDHTTADSTEAFIQQLADLDAEYAKAIERAKEAAEAQEELGEAYRDVTSALNSPTGLNLSLYRWMAGHGADDQVFGGWPGSGPRSAFTINVTINGATTPRETATMVVEEIRRQARLGGPSPLLLESA